MLDRIRGLFGRRRREKMKEARPPRRIEELCGVLSKGIPYEMDMMQKTGRILVSPDLRRGTVEQYAMLESFLLHVRILLEFLKPGNPAIKDEDTVIARDFFPSHTCWQGDSKRGEQEVMRLFESEIRRAQGWETRDFVEVRRKLNKKLAHVTYSNVQNEQWPTPLIQRGVEKGMAHFWKRVEKVGIEGLQLPPLLTAEGSGD